MYNIQQSFLLVDCYTLVMSVIINFDIQRLD